MAPHQTLPPAAATTHLAPHFLCLTVKAVFGLSPEIDQGFFHIRIPFKVLSEPSTVSGRRIKGWSCISLFGELKRIYSPVGTMGQMCLFNL